VMLVFITVQSWSMMERKNMPRACTAVSIVQLAANCVRRCARAKARSVPMRQSAA